MGPAQALARAGGWLIEHLIVLCLAVMVGATLLATVLRQVPGAPTLFWAEEVTRYVNIWVVFLASGIAIERGAHFGVDVFTEPLPAPLRRGVRLLALALMAVFELVLIVFGGQLAQANMAQLSSALEVPMGFVFLAIPVGGGLMLIATVREMIRVVGVR